MTGIVFEHKPEGLPAVLDSMTRRRIDNPKVEPDHWIELDIKGYRIGMTGRVRWCIEQDGDEEYLPEYLANVLEKVVEALRTDSETSDLTRYCPHDGQICRHECENNSCWRELDGS